MPAGNDIISIASLLLLFLLLLWAVVMDLRSRRIPNILLMSILNLALILRTTDGGVEGLVTAIAGLVVGLAMLLPIHVAGGMGAGDVKLLGVVGSFLGPWGAMVAGLATMMLGAIVGIGVILWQRVWPLLDLHVTPFRMSPEVKARTTSVSRPLPGRGTNTQIPYAPVIAAGTVASLWHIGYLPGRFLGLLE